MNVQRFCAIALALLLISTCHAQTIELPEVANLLANPGFETGDIEGWTPVLAGDNAGVIEVVGEAPSGDYAARIEAPTDRAWTVLRQQDFDVSIGETLVATAWVRASSSRAKMVLTGGFLWAGDPSGHQRVTARHSGSGEWEMLRVELPLEQLPVSLAIGFDYNSAGSSLLVDDVRLGRGSDVLAEEAAQWANELAQVVDREELPEWIRERLRGRIERGAELVEQYRATERDAEGFTELVAQLRDYSATRNQLITWVEDGTPSGESAGLTAGTIELEAGDGADATATIGMLNAFGRHSVAVRVGPGALRDMEAAEDAPVALAGDSVRVMELIPRDDGWKAVSPGEDLTVWAPVKHPRFVRVKVPTDELAPGTYNGTLTLLPLDPFEGGPPQEVAVRLVVGE